jgi:hypothetical protein
LLFAGLECELFSKAGVASARDAPSTLKPVKIDARTLIWIARVLTAIKVELILTPDPVSEPMPDEKNDDLAADGQLKRKGYERELARLHTEFVKLQQWVVHKPLKVCIVFEGRDGAGKGGTIKAMTERVSPRASGSSHSPRRPSGKSRRCTPSATFRICPRPGRS